MEVGTNKFSTDDPRTAITATRGTGPAKMIPTDNRPAEFSRTPPGGSRLTADCESLSILMASRNPAATVPITGARSSAYEVRPEQIKQAAQNIPAKMIGAQWMVPSRSWPVKIWPVLTEYGSCGANLGPKTPIRAITRATTTPARTHELGGTNVEGLNAGVVFRPNLDSFGRWILGSAAGVLPALVGTLDPKAGGALLPAGPLQKSCHLGVRPNRFQ